MIRRILKSVSLLASGPNDTVGGQAVMEGVMIRSKDCLAIAVRKPSGEIFVETRPWFSMTPVCLRKPFLRGFPVLLETLVNGIKALNFSAQQSLDEEEGEISPWAMALTMAGAIGFALLLFVVAPHLFSLGMNWLGLSGDAEALSFHMWDGLFKLLMFVGYILAISFIPEIRRVFQYHGAEHKVIWAHENSVELSPQAVRDFSRLHPRCGTTFLLFVLAVSIVLFTFLVPLLIQLWSPQNAVLKQAWIIGVKFVLMIPISAISYEIIKFSGKFHKSILCKALSCPGMAMQMLTTHEPDDAQIEVAIAALKGALGQR
ncbi:hypothetical protein NNJEOMEG_00399 [Fundidesulfovibrio magnetotacticus]|uniref:Metal-dependent enzyme n=1 Tax=Fundidesulfovibrio magnetotacticus TaxID=2730080 RepID=A0A6V8LLJ2_9BACT|nr:DUF1385 domain-containing protein [Fundidesulfovibrio magnetotacticus]GFK92574.1 hypothetical protein NNJEOMEG_00399 [Fundidesulfovibrio magnetotacticus]